MTHFDRFFACAVVALSPLLEACTSLASRSTSAPRTEEELFEHWPVVHRDQDATVRQDPSPSAPAGPSAQAGAQGSPTGASGADEEIAQEGKDWYIEVLPYLWLPAMHGQVGARGTTAPVGVNTSEAIDAMKDDLEGAFVAHSELGWNRFRFLADFSYVNLGSSTSTALGNVKSDIKQIIAELGMAYA
jgi:hypothetical protein